jgi:2',3'-cyclic-nucleotide 2'-phosphodiesterase (5'-nucleotidase family)
MNTSTQRFIILSFLAPVFLFLAGCATVPESGSADTARLTFIHINDTYRIGAVEDGSKGGFGRVATVVRDLQRQGKDVRILHGGDLLYPSLESQIWNGQQMVEALNFIDRLAPVYFVAGNHDFDPRTPDHLINAMRAAEFDWLGDNYQLNTGDAAVDAMLQSSFTFDYENKTIGIFSLTSHVADGGNSRDYVDVDKDYRAAAERVIQGFESQGVDLIIGLTHLYMAKDQEIAALRENHPTLLFVVGGHDHEPEFSALSNGSAAVMKGASNARVIWRIDVAFDADGLPHIKTTMLNLDQSVEIDADYEQTRQEWRARLLELYPFLEAKVGEAAFPLDATEETTRSRETAWGNFIVDQMLSAFGEPAADFAFINSGSLRIDDYIADDITFEDIGRTFGFSSFLRYLTISGAEFRQVMEAGYRGGGGSQGYFPQIAGFRVCIDRRRAVGQRIVSMQLPIGDKWQEIEAAREYTLVLPDFLYRGSDGYELPQDRFVSRSGSELKYLVLDAILRAQADGRRIGEMVSPANARYFVLRSDQPECFSP